MSKAKTVSKAEDLSFNVCHCLVSRQLARHVSRIYQKHFASTSITAGDLSILEFIFEAKEISTAALAEAMFMERTTLIRTLKPLQESGYIAVSPDPTLSRRHVLSLTSAGDEKRLEAREKWRLAQEEYEAIIGSEQTRKLRTEMLNALAAAAA